MSFARCGRSQRLCRENNKHDPLKAIGGNAVVIDHHLAKAGAGGHLQGEAMGFLHLGELGDGAVDALESILEQQAQGSGAAAFLDGFPPGLHPGDVSLQADLLLLEPLAGALLQRTRLSQQQPFRTSGISGSSCVPFPVAGDALASDLLGFLRAAEIYFRLFDLSSVH